MDRQRALLQLKALGESSRLDLFLQLVPGEMGGTDLLRSTGLSQPNLSRHIRVLREAGVIQERWVGRNAYYRLSDEPIARGIVGALGGRIPAIQVEAETGFQSSRNMSIDESNLESPAAKSEGVEIAPPTMEDWML